MRTLAQTRQQTRTTPEAIFKLWSAVDNWAEYDQGIEWAKLTDSFSAGGHYTLKPKGGPKVKATILVVDPNTRFIDVSHLFGAKLQFNHKITEEDGNTVVSITMTIDGPLSWLWAKILGKNQQSDLEQSTANLITKAEKAQ